MKYTALIFGLLLIPSISLAASLTNEQATSLVNVVQSSTTTPASAFVPLITAFSSITELQATTLIEVVQAAPGVPASAFINLLIAFTVDAPVITPILGSTETPVQSPTPTVIPTPQETTSAPVVQSVVMDTTSPQFESIEIAYLGNIDESKSGYHLRIWANELLDLSKTTFSGQESISTITYNGIDAGKSRRLGHLFFYEAKLDNVDETKSVMVTIYDMSGNATEKTLDIVFKKPNE